MSDLTQYKDLYIQTSREYLQSLNEKLLLLEKNPKEKESIDEIFRSAHSLKSQSAAMGYINTGFLCHTIEDVFYEIKEGKMELTKELADILFLSFDSLTNSIDHIERENAELNLSYQAESLKKITGVKTEGAGKSNRDQETGGQVSVVSDQLSDGQISDSRQDATANENPKTNEPKSDNPKSEDRKLKTEIKTISVKTEILDDMMNLLEEILVQRIKVKKIVSDDKNNKEMQDYFHESQKLIDALQNKVMQARAVPLSLVFDHFTRAVRDLARAENKDIELKILGGDLELDRTIVDRLDEPLIHLLRNAVSHGIDKKGVITISAKREKEYCLISVTDDGIGIEWDKVKTKSGAKNATDKELKDLLFSGISTSNQITQISGRGVGLTVVKQMVQSFGGNIDVASEKGKGTSFTLKLPLTLAIAKALLVQVGEENYAIPTLLIDRIIKLHTSSIKKTADQEAFVLDEIEVPLMRIAKQLSMITNRVENQNAPIAQDTVLAVVIENRNEKVGLIVDRVTEAADIVMKPVPDLLKHVTMFSGTTILNNGRTALILNPQEFM